MEILKFNKKLLLKYYLLPGWSQMRKPHPKFTKFSGLSFSRWETTGFEMIVTFTVNFFHLLMIWLDKIYVIMNGIDEEGGKNIVNRVIVFD